MHDPELLAQLLEDFHRRRALGESPRPEEYRERAGASFEEFRKALDAEKAIDGAMGEAAKTTFPVTFGPYTLTRELGRGAMGVVYEAVQRDLGRKVALKVLRTGFDTDANSLERFRREARACAQIRHDHVVPVYEAGEHEGRPFYAMALLGGRSLSDVRKQGDLGDARLLCGAMAGIADALAKMHEAGIVHRDVKPGNIMREEGGRLVLADFGLARTVASKSLTQSGESIGTPLYMSPEQLLGQQTAVDGRSDVYGLGATLYELIANRPLFPSDSIQALMRSILSERPVPLHEAAAGIPRDVSDVVMKSLEKEPKDRYQTAAELRDDLLRISRGEAVAGKPVGSVVHAGRRLRRQALPIAALLLVAAGAFVWFANRPAVVRIQCFPEARVFLDGAEKGGTPLSLEVPAGAYELKLQCEGFQNLAEPLRVSAGDRVAIQKMLLADPNDPGAVGKLAEQFEIALSEFQDDQTRLRGAGGDDEIHALYPRGEVRLADLDEFCFYVGLEAEVDGRLRFRAGDRTLHDAEFKPGDSRYLRAAIPEEVRKELKPGVRITFGYHPAKGKVVAGDFRVVEEDARVAKRLAEMEKRFAAQGPLVLGQMRAQLLLNKGLPYAAWREAGRVLESMPDCAHACVIRQQALRAMGLGQTPLGEETEAQARALLRSKGRAGVKPR